MQETSREAPSAIPLSAVLDPIEEGELVEEPLDVPSCTYISSPSLDKAITLESISPSPEGFRVFQGKVALLINEAQLELMNTLWQTPVPVPPTTKQFIG